MFIKNSLATQRAELHYYLYKLATNYNHNLYILLLNKVKMLIKWKLGNWMCDTSVPLSVPDWLKFALLFVVKIEIQLNISIWTRQNIINESLRFADTMSFHIDIHYISIIINALSHHFTSK